MATSILLLSTKICKPTVSVYMPPSGRVNSDSAPFGQLLVGHILASWPRIRAVTCPSERYPGVPSLLLTIFVYKSLINPSPRPG
jgi:hypothetical protein